MVATYGEAVNMVNKRSINFDTLKYANRLKAASVPDKQAEVQAELQAETIIQQTDAVYDFGNSIIKNLATKQDVKESITELRSELKQAMNRLEHRLDKSIARMGYKTMIVLVSSLASMAAVLGYLIKTN